MFGPLILILMALEKKSMIQCCFCPRAEGYYLDILRSENELVQPGFLEEHLQFLGLLEWPPLPTLIQGLSSQPLSSAAALFFHPQGQPYSSPSPQP